MSSLPPTDNNNYHTAFSPKNGGAPFYLGRNYLPRGGSPHSEAVASSEDERDPFAYSTKKSTMTARRDSSSWTAEVQAGSQMRRMSLGGLSLGNVSQPSTPGEQPVWGTKPFTNPWAQDMRREPPARLSAINASPQGLNPEDAIASPSSYQSFDIPHQSKLKAARSHSYSVGQNENETGSFAGSVGRPRAGLTRQPSSQLGQLSQLREEEPGPEAPSSRASSRSDVHLLKQAVRHRASTSNTNAPTMSHLHRTQTYPDTTSDFAIDEADDDVESEAGSQSSGVPLGMAINRRHSEFPGDFIPGRWLDGPQKKPWQTQGSSLGLDSLLYDDGSQSRRHSVAAFQQSHDLVLQGSRSPLGEPQHGTEREYAHYRTTSGEEETAIELSQAYDRAFANSYFQGFGPAMRSAQSSSAGIPATATNMINPYGPATLQRPTQHLYIVTFKCSRSDVYYIPENVGLEVKSGDMVIVEGDRGHDLGQVTQVDVSIEEARRHLKDMSEQHFRWLMMFSRHVQNSTGSFVNNPNGMLAASNGEAQSREGGMGPRPPIHTPSIEEIRPKMLKRLAQGHEIQVLRDKEGAEAKAKRICQQKAMEHGLTMEILDAEYQFDYHKLTFFYFAESYINFNSLVTELFKIYKARIWMSAVNAASFATPSAALTSLPPPSSLGPGATSNGGGYSSSKNTNTSSNSPAVGSSYSPAAFNGMSTFHHQLPMQQQYFQSQPKSSAVNSLRQSAFLYQPDLSSRGPGYQADAQPRSYYPYAPAQAQPSYGGFNPSAPSYAPAWGQNQPANRYAPYQSGLTGDQGQMMGGAFASPYSNYTGQDVIGTRSNHTNLRSEASQDLAKSFHHMSLDGRDAS